MSVIQEIKVGYSVPMQDCPKESNHGRLSNKGTS
jgi:hypothetical protein